MLRKIFLICCLVAFSLGTLVGCTPPEGDAAPPATTASE